MMNACKKGCWSQFLRCITTTSQDAPAIFDGVLKAAHRDRAALLPPSPDPLLDEVAERLIDRLEDCTRRFSRALVLGGAGHQILSRLPTSRIDTAVYVDTSEAMLSRAQQLQLEDGRRVDYVLASSSQESLPIEPESFDVVLSCLGLHWVNDVPGVMAQCRTALRPDGLFLAAMMGGTTLQELRISCTAAQQEREGGVSPRLSPLVRVRDAGNLLTRAGLSLPAVDVDDIQVNYPDILSLVEHLRAMGESNGLLERKQTLNRDTAMAAAAAYAIMFGGDGGFIPATYQVIYMTGWAPDSSQQKAAKRGSATVSFQDLQDAFK